MKYPINETFEKLILDGCKVIRKDSDTYDSANGSYTHILLECPKGYEHTAHKGRKVTFILIEANENIPSWYEATFYFSDKRHAMKSYTANLQEDRSYQYNKKRNSL